MKETEISLLYDEKKRLENEGVLSWMEHLELGVALNTYKMAVIDEYIKVCKQIKRLVG